MLKTEPTQRFSSRVDHYIRSRPSYPPEIIHLLREQCGLARESIVADIASGTGIFTHFVLENGNRVFGVEPNTEMRRAGEQYLSAFPNFVSIDGKAEATTLANESVDVITCAQAAHWFERDQAIAEFRRILKPGGFLVLIWNHRHVGDSGFGRDYEDLIERFGIDYAEVKRRDENTGGFFGDIPCKLQVFNNFQDFAYAALEGRLLSSSYVPQLVHPSYPAMLSELHRIFERYERGGHVRMEYDTKVYYGRLK
jgi:SAM-dependent methyltransferase